MRAPVHQKRNFPFLTSVNQALNANPVANPPVNSKIFDYFRISTPSRFILNYALKSIHLMTSCVNR